MRQLRPLRESDVAEVLALNEASVEMLAPMDEAHLHRLHALTDRFDVVDVDGRVAGFVMTFGPGVAYDSDNYRWFTSRYGEGDFYYLDRIALHSDFRRQGLGGLVYDDVERVAAAHGRLALEVNLVPRNDPSLAFHASRGFVEVGRTGDAQHLVSMQEKVLQPTEAVR